MNTKVIDICFTENDLVADVLSLEFVSCDSPHFVNITLKDYLMSALLDFISR